MKICPCGGVCSEYDMHRNREVVGFIAKCRACGRREEFWFRGGEVDGGGSIHRAETSESDGPAN